jgi:hypothetical protein
MKVSTNTSMNGATKSQPRQFRRARRALGAGRAGTGTGGAAVDVIVSPGDRARRVWTRRDVYVNMDGRRVTC